MNVTVTRSKVSYTTTLIFNHRQTSHSVILSHMYWINLPSLSNSNQKIRLTNGIDIFIFLSERNLIYSIQVKFKPYKINVYCWNMKITHGFILFRQHCFISGVHIIDSYQQIFWSVLIHGEILGWNVGSVGCDVGATVQKVSLGFTVGRYLL